MLKIICCLLSALLLSSPIHAAYTVKNGGLVHVDQLAKFPPQEHFRMGIQAMEDGKYDLAVAQFNIVNLNFPHSPFAKEALFHLGSAYLKIEEYDLSNKALTQYLKESQTPKHFEEAVCLKYQIAENFRLGAKRHLFGYQKMPKWQTGKTMALEIFEEVVSLMPNHEVAAKALFSKGLLEWSLSQYKESCDSFQKLIRRFPKEDLTPESYLKISKVYLDQCQKEFQNSDLIAFAEINLKHFEEDFPRDERLEQAAMNLVAIKEIYASGLFTTGQFYERVGKPKASILYYQKAIVDYPDTKVADVCRNRLKRLAPS